MRRVFLVDGSVMFTASDLTRTMACEFAGVRALDVELGRAQRPARGPDPMGKRIGALTRAHRGRVLAGWRERAGGLVTIERSGPLTGESARIRHEATLAALRAGVAAVADGMLLGSGLSAGADLLVRADLLPPDGAPWPGQDGAPAPATIPGTPNHPAEAGYAVVHTTFAQRAKPKHVLTLAAAADVLDQAGIPLAGGLHLHLGTDRVTNHPSPDVLGVLRENRRHVRALLTEHLAADEPAAWGDERYRACGYCDACRAELEPARDVRLVWGTRRPHRAALRDAGITTIDALAASTGPVAKMRSDVLDRLRDQAAIQLRQEEAEAAGSEPHVFAAVHRLDALEALPEPDPGDVFFDFEGDPFWVDGDRSQWGLEYLFGVVEHGDGGPRACGAPGTVYRTFWAHDRAQEKRALIDFLAYLRERRRAHPGLHVYHYAFYEPAALRTLAARHGVGAAEVEQLIDAGVFVDLYDTVKYGVHVSQRSYSIKKLEPLYMGDHLRDADVTDGGASVVAYADAVAARDEGRTEEWEHRLADLADYNAYDCLSTLRLRDWLLDLRESARDENLDGAAASVAALLGADPGVTSAEEQRGAHAARHGRHAVAEPADPLAEALAASTDPAAPLLAAALDYHRREDEPFWAEHHRRLATPALDVTDTRDVLEVHEARALSDWAPNERGNLRRRLRLVGRLGTGSTVDAGSEVFLVHEAPLPPRMVPDDGELRVRTDARVLRRAASAAGLDLLEVEERARDDVGPHPHLPAFVTPGWPPRTGPLRAAIRSVALALVQADPDAALPWYAPDVEAEGPVPAPAVLDLLRRTPPRRLAAVGAGPADPYEAVRAAVLGSTDSYVAVQGPPGTGKTHLGARLIADLVGRGRRVGVVAQSHAVVDHLLSRALEAGVDPRRVAKRDRAGASTPWLSLGGYDHERFLARPGGLVLGGTAWDFANRKRVPAGALDLLVIDEAGQFSLANTIAVGTAARRLLLLGDPQQLPQVTHGHHPAPVDASALGWLGVDGTLPAELGFFLDRTHRMHPDLCAPVSALAYDGRLEGAPITGLRRLDGLEPGLHAVAVSHRGNVVDSPEEAAEVLAQIDELLGLPWSDGANPPRPLAAADVIVVAAYNAQVQRVRAALDAVGLDEVRVGTVDRFQGQEAAVAILTLATSSGEDAPRGLDFLLSRHRLNVAISRGQWAAIVVHSPALVHHLPTRESSFAQLAAFVRLLDGAIERRPRA